MPGDKEQLSLDFKKGGNIEKYSKGESMEPQGFVLVNLALNQNANDSLAAPVFVQPTSEPPSTLFCSIISYSSSDNC